MEHISLPKVKKRIDEKLNADLKKIRNNPTLPLIGNDQVSSLAVMGKKIDDEYDYKRENNLDMRDASKNYDENPIAQVTNDERYYNINT